MEIYQRPLISLQPTMENKKTIQLAEIWSVSAPIPIQKVFSKQENYTSFSATIRGKIVVSFLMWLTNSLEIGELKKTNALHKYKGHWLKKPQENQNSFGESQGKNKEIKILHILPV